MHASKENHSEICLEAYNFSHSVDETDVWWTGSTFIIMKTPASERACHGLLVAMLRPEGYNLKTEYMKFLSSISLFFQDEAQDSDGSPH